jgi:hypothetical protein
MVVLGLKAMVGSDLWAQDKVCFSLAARLKEGHGRL